MHPLGWSRHSQRTGGLAGPRPAPHSAPPSLYGVHAGHRARLHLRLNTTVKSQPLPPSVPPPPNSWLVPVPTSLVSGLGDAPNSPFQELPKSFLSFLHSFFFLHFPSHSHLLGSGLFSPSPLLPGLPHSSPASSLGSKDFTFHARSALLRPCPFSSTTATAPCFQPTAHRAQSAAPPTPPTHGRSQGPSTQHRSGFPPSLKETPPGLLGSETPAWGTPLASRVASSQGRRVCLKSCTQCPRAEGAGTRPAARVTPC